MHQRLTSAKTFWVFCLWSFRWGIFCVTRLC